MYVCPQPSILDYFSQRGTFSKCSLEVRSISLLTPVAGVRQQGFGRSPRRLAEVLQHFPSVAWGPNPSHSSLACLTWNTPSEFVNIHYGKPRRPYFHTAKSTVKQILCNAKAETEENAGGRAFKLFMLSAPKAGHARWVFYHEGIIQIVCHHMEFLLHIMHFLHGDSLLEEKKLQ